MRIVGNNQSLRQLLNACAGINNFKDSDPGNESELVEF